jgi:hypothetical protein
MTAYWTNFGISYSPSGPGVPTWLPFAARADNIQSFVPPSASEETNFIASHHCRFWAPVINPS